MMDMFATQAGFSMLLFSAVVGAVGSVLLRKDDDRANTWSSFFAVLTSLWGILFAVSSIVRGHNLVFSFGPSSFQLLSLSFHIDSLAAFFILVISLISLFCSIFGVGYVKHYYKEYNIGMLGFFYHLFIADMLLVVSASNGFLFLMAWEVMSVVSYFLVVYERNDERNIKAGFLYLIMTHVGTAFIILSFLLLYQYSGSFEFAVLKSAAAHIPQAIKNAIFVFAVIGFGTKAGVVPFHIWLPAAHSAAPSHVSALMSGVMIKVGIYMMIRIFIDILWPVPSWWGLTIIVIGSVSALLGVLYALTEHDIKKLLAYHSIENIGIILLGIGSAITFSSLGLPSLALLGFVAALFHTLNHATFKSLLFLGAGSVINQTHTRNLEEYGGLIKSMPQTAFFFLIGSVAISALPPFNGFFSEWLTFQSLFQGISSLDSFAKWIFIFAAGALALTGGLALACFVKAFGVTFLARPRSLAAVHAEESTVSLRIAMAALSALTLLFGLCSSTLVSFLEKIGNDFDAFQNIPAFASLSSGYGLSVENGFASVSSSAFFVFLILAVFLLMIVIQRVINRDQKVTVGATWDCGTDLTSRMEITATGFARSIVLIFRGILKPTIQDEVEYHDSETRYMPTSRTVTLGIRDVHHSYFYEPMRKFITALSLRAKNIQSGIINTYISYIFIALIIALFTLL